MPFLFENAQPGDGGADSPDVYSPHHGRANTGLRLDFSALPVLDDFKLSLDIIAVDLFDQGKRGLSVGITFGVPVFGYW
jgi:hypothetical protein